MGLGSGGTIRYHPISASAAPWLNFETRRCAMRRAGAFALAEFDDKILAIPVMIDSQVNDSSPGCNERRPPSGGAGIAMEPGTGSALCVARLALS